MNIFARLILALACASSINCEAKLITLTCGDNSDDRTLIKRFAPDVVTRINQHQLNILTKVGSATLVDKPPHDEPLSGVHYLFCDRRDGFLLITMQDDTRFGGKLINEQTGAITDAGQDVVISHDERAYFAAVQPNGLDGEEWSIYAINGKKSWSGYSFIPQKDNPGQFYAYLEHPTWLPSGEFTATASCASKIDMKWTVKLVKNQGEWSWKPLKRCP